MIYAQINELYEPLREKLKYEEKIVSCACCEKHLVKIYIPDIDLPSPMYYIFMCPFCGEESFKQIFNKKMWFEPINCKILDIKYDKIITVELK